MRVSISTFIIFMVWQISSAFAFNQEDIAIHGFVSQGYLRSSDNNYLGKSKDGSFEFNELGLNFSVPISDDLHFGSQLFSMDLGNYGNNKLYIDWAFLDYTWRYWLGFRAGKIKMPAGLYNRQRDADMLRTSILLPQCIYMPNSRDLIAAIYGADIYGTKEFGAFGYIDYEVYLGTMDIPKGAPYVTETFMRLNYSMPSLGGAFSGDLLSEFNISTRHIEGGMLCWQTPLSGLRLNGTFMAGLIETSLDEMSTEAVINALSILSAEYEINNVTFAAEYFLLDMKTETTGSIEGLLNITTEMEGYYGSISWEMFDWLALSTSYGEYYPDKNDKKGRLIAAGGLPDYFAWQKDITISVRFNINSYCCIKFETHIIDGLGSAEIAENNDHPYENTEQNWLLFATKTSLNF